jgi:hypothetical protein
MAGRPSVTVHDTFDYPLILQFGATKDYNSAFWVVPSFARRIPTWRLSEIRVEEGTLDVLIDGPEGFRCGPYPATSVRTYYPRDKHCALLRLDPEGGGLQGVTITTVDETLFVEDYPVQPSSELA